MNLANCLIVFLLAAAAFAQDSGALLGTVRGPDRALLNGVQVTIRDQASRAETIVFTNSSGFFRASNLPPAYYTVEAVRPEFQAESRHDLSVRAGSEVRQDFVLSNPATRWTMPATGTIQFMFLSALIPLIVSLFFTEPGRKLSQYLWAPVTWTKGKVYEFLAPRFPERIGLRGYRKRVLRSDIARIENPVSPSEVTVPLERAYARFAEIRILAC